MIFKELNTKVSPGFTSDSCSQIIATSLIRWVNSNDSYSKDPHAMVLIREGNAYCCFQGLGRTTENMEKSSGGQNCTQVSVGE